MCARSASETFTRRASGSHRNLSEQAGDVVGDSARLHQVFWNLLNNAAKFTPEGGDVYVTAEHIDDGNAVRVTIGDTGIGMASEALPRIFDAFEQGELRITRKFGGMGLAWRSAGCSSKRTAERSRAESDGLGKGSTFVVELPAISPKEAAAVVPAMPQSSDTPTRPLRLMLVEDHPDTARVLGRLLSMDGHSVEIVNTAGPTRSSSPTRTSSTSHQATSVSPT